MPQHITMQPNGKYAIFSTVVDSFIGYNATRDEVCQHFRELAVAESERQTTLGLKCADELAAMRFDDDIHTIETIHGTDEAAKYRALLSADSDDPASDEELDPIATLRDLRAWLEHAMQYGPTETRGKSDPSGHPHSYAVRSDPGLATKAETREHY